MGVGFVSMFGALPIYDDMLSLLLAAVKGSQVLTVAVARFATIALSRQGLVVERLSSRFCVTAALIPCCSRWDY